MKKIIRALTFITLSVVLLGCPTNPTTTDEEINEDGEVVTPTTPTTEITYHNVRFIDNGVVSTIKVADGSTIDETDIPTPTERKYCDGYWRAEDDTAEFDFTTSITSDVTLVSDYYVHYVEFEEGYDVDSIIDKTFTVKYNSETMATYDNYCEIGWTQCNEYSYIYANLELTYNYTHEYYTYKVIRYGNSNVIYFVDDTNYDNGRNHNYLKNITVYRKYDSDDIIIEVITNN